uniref:Uncharacterized protein n=1 Tax=Tanacetum cinerariifolium TaxID=118510 RepID=A0A699IF97_TANCI|nr:hypothetical protein [Tanacetum cinerariifolium]
MRMPTSELIIQSITREARNDKHYTPCYNRIRQASRYNFKATITDGIATAEFTFFIEAGEKMTCHTCSHLKEKFEATDKTQLPIEMVNMIEGGVGSAVVATSEPSFFVGCALEVWRGIVEMIVCAMVSNMSGGGVSVKNNF